VPDPHAGSVPWTPELLRLEAGERTAEPTLPDPVRDALLRQAEAVVTSVIAPGARIAPEVLTDFITVVADGMRDDPGFRKNALLAHLIARDLGVAGGLAPLVDPTAAGAYRGPELALNRPADADSLTEEQLASARAWSEDLGSATRKQVARGYLPPRVLVAGSPTEVEQVRGLLPADVPFEVEVEDERDGVDVHVRWDLRRAGEPKAASVEQPPVRERETDDAADDYALPLRRSVHADERWRHETAPTAEWFEPDHPVPLADLRAARARVPVTGWVRGEHTAPCCSSRVTPEEVSLSLIAGGIHYDVRAFEVGGKAVRDLTVRLFLHTPSPETTPEAVATVRERTLQGVDGVFNQGYRLPGGEQFHLTVEFVDTPAEAHATVWIIPPWERASQYSWPEDAPYFVYAHEVGHSLGLADEYAEEEATGRVLLRNKERSGVANDYALMHNPWFGRSRLFVPRYAWRIYDAMRALESPYPPAPEVEHRYSHVEPDVMGVPGAPPRDPGALEASPAAEWEDGRPGVDDAPWTPGVVRAGAVEAGDRLTDYPDEVVAHIRSRARWLLAQGAAVPVEGGLRDDLVDVIAVALLHREPGAVRSLVRQVVADLGVAPRLDDAGTPVERAGTRAEPGGESTPGVEASPPWTPESLADRVRGSLGVLEDVPGEVRAKAFKQAREVVAHTTARPDAIPATALADLTTLVAIDLARNAEVPGYYRGAVSLALGIALDLGVAAEPSSLFEVDGTPRRIAPERSYAVQPGATGLTEAQLDDVEVLAADLGHVAHTRREQGYLPPAVEVSGVDAHRVKDVLAGLTELDVRVVEGGRADGADVFVDWALKRTRPHHDPVPDPLLGDPATRPTSTAAEREVLDDRSWKYRTDPSAPWFAPRDPVPSWKIRAARAAVPVSGIVRGSAYSVMADAQLGPDAVVLRRGHIPIAYDTRVFDVDGVRVRDFTVKLFLDARDANEPGKVNATPEELLAMQNRVRDGVEKLLNRGYRLPGGEQFHVTVEFVTRHRDAHSRVWVTRGGRPSQHRWPVRIKGESVAHELLHNFGERDQYRGEGEHARMFRVEPDAVAVFEDGGLMSARVKGGTRALKPRHLWGIENTRTALEVPVAPATTRDHPPIEPDGVDEGDAPPLDDRPDLAPDPGPGPEASAPGEPETPDAPPSPRALPEYFRSSQALGPVAVTRLGSAERVTAALVGLLPVRAGVPPEGVDQVERALHSEFESLLGPGRTFQVRVGERWFDAHVKATLEQRPLDGVATTTPLDLVMPDARMTSTVQAGTVTDGGSAGDFTIAAMASQGVGAYGMLIGRVPRAHPHTYTAAGTAITDQTMLRSGDSDEVRLPVRYTVTLLDEIGGVLGQDVVAGPDVDVTLQVPHDLSTFAGSEPHPGTGPVAPTDPDWGLKLERVFPEAVTDVDTERAFTDVAARLHPSITRPGADGRTRLRDFLSPTGIRDHLVPMLGGWVTSPDLTSRHGGRAGAVRMRAVLKEARFIGADEEGRLRSRPQAVDNAGTSASIATGFDLRASAGGGIGMPDPVLLGAGVTVGYSSRETEGSSAGNAITRRTGVEIDGDVGLFKVVTDVLVSAPTGPDVVVPVTSYLRLSLPEAARLGLPVPPGTPAGLTEPGTGNTRFELPHVTEGTAVGRADVGAFAPAAEVQRQVETALRELPGFERFLPTWNQEGVHPLKTAVNAADTAEQLDNLRSLTTKLSPSALRLNMEELLGPGVSLHLTRRGWFTKDLV
ncbi:hypothetical protein AB0G02_27670, partial [Actinosynnema sp. NPDC023658]|uniref:hypothetical protein n=1 Tax=Actinosynnema sp. NPDC023658 TaxID=3155465 RepID=UPI0034113DF5